MMLIVLEVLFATYTLVPSGLTYTPQGILPTGIVEVIVLVSVFMTVRLLPL